MRRALLLLACSFFASCDSCDDEELEKEIARSGGDGTPEVREIVLPGAPAEAEEAGMLSSGEPGLHDVLGQIRAVAEHASARGIFLRVGPLASWGRASDLSAALRSVREADKPVHCHFDLADNITYWLLATSCDRISMTPGGYLDLVGFAAQALYFRSALDELGIQAEMLQIGRFKGAADPFVRDDMPPEVETNLRAILTAYGAALQRAIEEGRHLPAGSAATILDQGPFDALLARETGLIDDVGFEDEAREHAREAASVARVRRVRLRPRPPEMGIGDLMGALAGETPSVAPEGPRIALVRLTGTIVDGEYGDEARQAGPFVRNLWRIADDADVKAVVLRIDSPGGSALASDRMWEAVRRVAAKKPIVVSLGDMAASGGYYIASGASRIFAHAESLVGSIGVVGGKVDLSGLLERVSIHSVVLPSSERSAWSSPLRPWSDAEREVVRQRLRATYHLFLRRIRTVRPNADLANGAAGRLMVGARALELGLIDEIGGLEAALAYARSEGHVDDTEAIELWPRPKTAMDALATLLGGDPEARAPEQTLPSALVPFAGEWLDLSHVLHREGVAAALPYRFSIR